jgi:hypothetical protein
MKIKLKRLERIVAVTCERPSGPVWADAPVVVVHIVDERNKYRSEYIQPAQYSTEVSALFNVCHAANASMMMEIGADVEWEKT